MKKSTNLFIWAMLCPKSRKSITVKLSLCIFLILQLSISGFAQKTSTKYDPLTIGDKIPKEIWEMPMDGITSNGIANSTTKLADYKGKIIILDFWAAWCSSCIVKFPTLETLEKKFPGDLNVILVNCLNTGDDETRISGILSGSKAPFIKTNLQGIIKDRVLNELFPHRYLPHYAWIGKDGKLLALSGADLLDEETVNKFLARH